MLCDVSLKTGYLKIYICRAYREQKKEKVSEVLFIYWWTEEQKQKLDGPFPYIPKGYVMYPPRTESLPLSTWDFPLTSATKFPLYKIDKFNPCGVKVYSSSSLLVCSTPLQGPIPIASQQQPPFNRILFSGLPPRKSHLLLPQGLS